MKCSQLNTQRWHPQDVAENTQTSYRCWNNAMCPQKVDSIQKRGLSKHFVDSNNSTVSDSILLFVERLYLDDPYKIFARPSSLWFNKVLSRLWRLSRNFILFSENKWECARQCLVVSVSALQRHNGVTVSEKYGEIYILSGY